MIDFRPVTPEQIEILKNIVNSNPEYNVLSDGHAQLTDDEILEMYHSSKKQGAFMNFIVDGDRFLGVINYLMENPSDKKTWLGLLMIHSNYHGLGYAVEDYRKYEDFMRNEGAKYIRLGVIKGNERASKF